MPGFLSELKQSTLANCSHGEMSKYPYLHIMNIAGYLHSYFAKCTGWAKKPDHFLKCLSPIYDEVGRQSIY